MHLFLDFVVQMCWGHFCFFFVFKKNKPFEPISKKYFFLFAWVLGQWKLLTPNTCNLEHQYQNYLKPSFSSNRSVLRKELLSTAQSVCYLIRCGSFRFYGSRSTSFDLLPLFENSHLLSVAGSLRMLFLTGRINVLPFCPQKHELLFCRKACFSFGP